MGLHQTLALNHPLALMPPDALMRGGLQHRRQRLFALKDHTSSSCGLTHRPTEQRVPTEATPTAFKAQSLH